MKKPINVKLIRKILKFVEADLRRLDMGDFAYTKEQVPEIPEANFAECGTKACLAGWAVLLQEPKSKWHKIAQKIWEGNAHAKGKRLLGFTEMEAQRVFYSGGYSTAQKQLDELKITLNSVFEMRGMKERV